MIYISRKNGGARDDAGVLANLTTKGDDVALERDWEFLRINQKSDDVAVERSSAF